MPNYLRSDNSIVNQTSARCGEFVGSTSTVVLIAGPSVNQAVAYHEQVYQGSPVYTSCDGSTGTCSFISRATGQSWQVWPLTPGNDYMLIEAFRDFQGRNVYVISGSGWRGTLASAVYFNSVIYPNIGSYTASWYVYHWQDATTGLSQNGFPDPGDTYTLVTSS